MMDAEDKYVFNRIDRMMQQGESLALFRKPRENVIRYVHQKPGVPRVILYDIEELNGQTGFVIAPFKTDLATPIVLLKPEMERVMAFDFTLDCPDGMESDVCCQILDSRLESSNHEPPTKEYAACFDVFINALNEKEFNKLVLSRSRTLDIPLQFSPATVFYEACCRYVHSYVYLCHSPETGTWLGSTPEIILSGEKDEWNTVALAGTQPLINGRLPNEWDEKNREEQKYVASYVREKLLSFGVQPSECGPYPAYAGALSHLKTDFHFSLPDNDHLGNLLKLLHPTPAVCGLPKEKAFQFILDHEDHTRCYYSGFIGMLNPKGKTDLYVNLRCMNIAHQTLTLYAGGGLLASSELEDEWHETEEKMQTILHLVDNIHCG